MDILQERLQQERNDIVSLKQNLSVLITSLEAGSNTTLLSDGRQSLVDKLDSSMPELKQINSRLLLAQHRQLGNDYLFRALLQQVSEHNSDLAQF
jgi:hypothetical protein